MPRRSQSRRILMRTEARGMEHTEQGAVAEGVVDTDMEKERKRIS